MSQTVIIARGFANGAPCPHEGQYLLSFDFDAHDGQGWGEFTSDPAKAKRFKDKISAAEFWRTISKARPVRSDGQPNRPLTALTCEITEISDE